jgi:hypothetical protein
MAEPVYQGPPVGGSQPVSARCRSCRHWERDLGDGTDGICHRYPPITVGGRGLAGGFPHTLDYEWCGEYEPAYEAPTWIPSGE